MNYAGCKRKMNIPALVSKYPASDDLPGQLLISLTLERLPRNFAISSFPNIPVKKNTVANKQSKWLVGPSSVTQLSCVIWEKNIKPSLQWIPGAKNVPTLVPEYLLSSTPVVDKLTKATKEIEEQKEMPVKKASDTVRKKRKTDNIEEVEESQKPKRARTAKDRKGKTVKKWNICI